MVVIFFISVCLLLFTQQKKNWDVRHTLGQKIQIRMFELLPQSRRRFCALPEGLQAAIIVEGGESITHAGSELRWFHDSRGCYKLYRSKVTVSSMCLFHFGCVWNPNLPKAMHQNNSKVFTASLSQQRLTRKLYRCVHLLQKKKKIRNPDQKLTVCVCIK